MFGPRNLEEAKRYRYNKWAGNPQGWAYDTERCAWHVFSERGNSYQCLRKPGHGTDGIFCKQHARMREAR